MEQTQKQKHDLEMRRKQQELEDRVTFNLARAERDKEQEIRKVRVFTIGTGSCGYLFSGNGGL